MDLPQRKKIRLEGYDYSSAGGYFTKQKNHTQGLYGGWIGNDEAPYLGVSIL